MNALVVYESIYGNTHAVAEAIAEGMGGAQVRAVNDADGREPVDLLVVGGPTHMHGLATNRSREMAAAAGSEDEGVHVEEGAADEPGLRAWLSGLPDGDGSLAAAFDTRLDKSPWLTGVASRGIAKRLRRHHYQVLGTASFLVEDSEGPLEEGEIDRARAWGAELVKQLTGVASGSVT